MISVGSTLQMRVSSVAFSEKVQFLRVKNVSKIRWLSLAGICFKTCVYWHWNFLVTLKEKKAEQREIFRICYKLSVP